MVALILLANVEHQDFVGKNRRGGLACVQLLPLHYNISARLQRELCFVRYLFAR